ncbi:50S ribosomal protein L33 [Buchnera aphidicola (Hormaphis cornu)]|nr:50S ribosomal protein L33 [Buchnera aphidicola (Hormaphis cornu)]
MAKNTREKIKLISSGNSKYFYTTTKNKRNKPEKLKLKKYDPILRKHLVFKESKIK